MRRDLVSMRGVSVAALLASMGLMLVAGALAAQPRAGKTYTGFTSQSYNGWRAPVSFKVSSKGRRLLAFTWTGAGCAGLFGGPVYPWTNAWVIYKVGTINVPRTGRFYVKNVSRPEG